MYYFFEQKCYGICICLGFITLVIIGFVHSIYQYSFRMDVHQIIKEYKVSNAINAANNATSVINDKNINLISSLKEMEPTWSLKNKKYPFYFNSYNEYYLNCDSTNNIKYDVTFISALMLINETVINGTSSDDRPSHNYTHTIIKLLKYAYKPLILFISKNIEINKKLLNNIISIRNQTKYPPTIIISLNIKDTESYMFIKQKELESKNALKNELEITKCIVWNEKIVFLKNSVLRNPFNSRYFFWMDAGIFRYHHENLTVFSKFPIPSRLELLNNDKFMVGIRNPFSCDNYKKRIFGTQFMVSGTIYAGSKMGILKGYNAYRQSLIAGLNSKLPGPVYPKFICNDQEVMTFAICNNPDIFTTVFERVNDKTRSHYYQLLNLFSNIGYHSNRIWDITS